MKQFAFLFNCILLSANLNAQIETFQTRLKDSTMNLLYIGVPNPVRIKNLPDHSTLKLSHGDIRHWQKDNIFDFMTTGYAGDTLKISNSGRVIYTKAFKVASFTDPKVRLGIIKKEFATVAEVLVQPELIVYMDSCYFKYKLSVVSFDCSLVCKSNEIPGFNIIGSKLLKEQIDIIKRMKRGDQIIFENIKMRGPDSRTRTMDDFTITIN